MKLGWLELAALTASVASAKVCDVMVHDVYLRP